MSDDPPEWSRLRASPFFDLDGNPVDRLAWARIFEDFPARVVAQESVGPYWVSTVWIGIDQRFMGSGPPLIFESMVFWRAGDDGPDVDRMALDEDTTRYPTREAAERGHRELVALVRAELDVAGQHHDQ